MRNKYWLAVVLLVGGLITGCQPVKEYQKTYLNDSEMEMGARRSQLFESNFHSYREAASGANGGKTGGGCGCN